MINYINGDATFPERITPDKTNIIVHCCNDIGAWGLGFVLSISKRWKEPQQKYLQNYRKMKLGDIQLVEVENKMYVCNMIGQRGIFNHNNLVPVDYKALENGFRTLKEKTREIKNVALHMPRIGCGLAKGNWNIVENIINRCFENSEISIYVYDFVPR